MWITGFDVPCLAVLYNDKPLKASYVNSGDIESKQKVSGQKFGLVVDYLGIRNNMKKALKIFDDGKEMVDPVRLDPIEEAKKEAIRYLQTR